MAYQFLNRLPTKQMIAGMQFEPLVLSRIYADQEIRVLSPTQIMDLNAAHQSGKLTIIYTPDVDSGTPISPWPGIGTPFAQQLLAQPDAAGVLSLLGVSGGGGSGSVTSVGLSAPGIFQVTNSPVTSTGTLTLTLATQSANQVWAGPASGAAAQPSFRALVTADLPAGLFQNPMTAVGDLIVGTTAGVPSTLAIGAEGTMLSVVSGTPAWITALVGTTGGDAGSLFLTNVNGFVPGGGTNNIGLGTGLNVFATNSIIIGQGANDTSGLAKGNNILIGYHARMGGAFSASLAIGYNSYCYGDQAVVLGNNAQTSAFGGIAIGSGSDALASRSIAIGYNSYASGGDGVAIGDGAQVTQNNSVAIGVNSTAGNLNEFSVGKPGQLTRKITNVTTGTNLTDAAVVGQIGSWAGINTQAGNYTLVLSDASQLLMVGAATGAVAWTVPTDANVAYPMGTVIGVANNSGQALTVSGDTGVTIVYSSAYTGGAVASAVAVARLVKVATDTWWMY